MLRISEYMRDALEEKPIRRADIAILIWNLTNLCNLFCEHCYANAHTQKETELSLEEIDAILPHLWRQGIRFIIVSGGEPLVRKDLFAIAARMKQQGFKTYLSSNGLLINEDNLPAIQEHFDYVGISIDGRPEVHDRFRMKKGAFERSLRALEMCHAAGIRVGMRYTLTTLTLDSLPFVLDLVEEKGFPKLYISHLVYAGRAQASLDLSHEAYLGAMETILGRAFDWLERDAPYDLVTGNNEADARLLLDAFSARYPRHREHLERRLLTWGGNQSGARLVNINHRGDVKPDPFFPVSLGNLREHDFSQIWEGLPDQQPLLQSLRAHPRPVHGKCADCSSLLFCNGNSRARAKALYDDFFAEDPSCAL
ncbi:radical SAM protein [Myxococcota bacterium]|nr:radical SAM protein [Myxococcota bacterium]